MTFFKKLQGRWRLLLGFCPKCNSNAPEIYTCNVCDYKNNYWGRKISEDRKYWWNRFIAVDKIEQ